MKEIKHQGFSPYHKLVIFILAITQFTVFLGFMIMAPMGDMLMKSIHLSPAQFGTIVSAYAFSAGISGLITAAFADRFDRKKLLLFFYIGFILGTFSCSLASSYLTLVLARVITGIFGGVIGSISLAIVTDLFGFEKRGRVMGLVQMGLGTSQVMGIPIGLYLGNTWGWQSAFLGIATLACFIALLILWKLQPINAHLQLQKANNSILKHLWRTFTNKQYIIAYAASALLMFGGYLFMPFSSVFAVNNLGVSEEQLPFLFMCSGISSLIVMPTVGRLSDKYDKLKILAIAITWMIIMLIIYTHLGPTPFVLVVITNILMMIGVLSRGTPSSALISAVPEIEDRGAFMSMNSALQQFAGGIAAWTAGLIIYQPTPDSPIEHYPIIGYTTAVFNILSLLLMLQINRYVKNRLKNTEGTILPSPNEL